MGYKKLYEEFLEKAHEAGYETIADWSAKDYDGFYKTFRELSKDISSEELDKIGKEIEEVLTKDGAITEEVN